MSALSCSDPPSKRVGADDGDDFLELGSQLPTELCKSTSLGRSGDDPLRQPRTQNAILFSQKHDLPGEFWLSQGSQEREQGMQDRHGNALSCIAFCVMTILGTEGVIVQ